MGGLEISLLFLPLIKYLVQIRLQTRYAHHSQAQQTKSPNSGTRPSPLTVDLGA